MGGLNLTLETAKRTLLNTQVQVQTASHNISNAENKAYARQKAVQMTATPYQTRAGWVGTGSRLERIVQQRDQFIERRLMASISKESDYAARSSYLEVAEAYLRDDGELGLSSQLGAFWDAWESLNQNPQSPSQRALVEATTQNLVDSIRETYSNLVNMSQDIEGEISDAVSQANALLSRIADYNHQIVKNEFGGQPANDLRDLRYQALTELSELLPVNYREEVDGSLTITLEAYSTQNTLVTGDQAGSMAYDTGSHILTANPVPPETGTASLNNELSGGRLNGLLTAYQSLGTSHDLSFVLASPEDPSLTYLDRLNAFTATLITEVNNVHTQASGSNVFDDSVLLPDFRADQIQIASNFTADAGQALAVADLQDQSFASFGNASFNQYLSDIQQRIGLDHQCASSQATFQGAVRQELSARQQSVSGVSIDEEMVDILKFQQIYQAAAKVIQHSAEMLNAVIEMV